MILEVRDHKGELITSLSIFDDVFHRMELEAAQKGISVEAHILALLREELKKMSKELDNEQDEA